MDPSDSSDMEMQSGESTPKKCSYWQEKYEELHRGYALLESQFKEAVSIGPQMEKLQTENTNLISQLRSVKAEKEDLEHRLELSLQNNRDLASKIEKDKKTNTSERDSDISTMKKEFEKLKQASKVEIDKLIVQLEETQEMHEKERIENKRITSKVDKLLQASERYFEQSFDNLDSLTTLLEQPKAIKQEAPKVETRQVSSAPVTAAVPVDHEKKLKKMKTKLRATLQQKEKTEDDLKRLQKDTYEARAATKQQIAALERQISQMNDDKTAIEAQNRITISNLQAEKASLEADLLKTKTKLRTMKKQAIAQPAPQPAPPVQANEEPVIPKRDREAEAEKEKFIQKIHDLTEEVKNSEAKKESLFERLHESEVTINQLQVMIERQKADLSSLELVHKDSLKEIDSLRNALHSKEMIDKKAIKEAAKLKQPNPRVVKLEKALEESKKQIYALEFANNKQVSVIADKDQRIRELEAEQERLEGVVTQHREEIRSVQIKAEAIPRPTVEEIVPPESFTGDFESDLTTVLSEIAHNDSLQPASKIQQALKAVAKHYQEKIVSWDAALLQEYGKNQDIMTRFHQFLVDATIALTGKAITINEFLEGDNGSMIVSQIRQMMAANNDLKHRCETQSNILGHFAHVFNGCYESGAEPTKQIADVKEKMDNQAALITQRGKKIKSLKASLTQIEKEAVEAEEAMSKEITDLKSDLQQMTEERDELNEALGQTKARCQELADDLDNANQTRCDMESTMIEDHENEIQALVQEKALLETTLRGEIDQLTQKLDTLTNEYNESEEQVARQKQTIQSLRAAKKQRDLEYDELVKDALNKEEQAAIRLEEEKKNITESYENAMAELHKQCDAHRSDVEKLRADLTEAENQTSKTKITVMKLQKDNRKANSEIQTLQGQLEREKKLMETNLRAAKITAESQYSLKLEEMRDRSESEKRSLYTHGVDTFRGFFNASEQINERSFKAVLEKARDELSRLSKADKAIRRMVGASEQQTTEDAVAQVVMNT